MAVTAPVSTVDPPDLSFGPTSRHLTQEWWRERRLVAFGLVCALATTVLSIAIPVLVQRVIDNVIVAQDHWELALYLGLIVLCAVLRFATNSTRRAVTSRIGIVIENRLRAKLYDAYLTYPRAFYDRHATGQVLSRATNDLYPIIGGGYGTLMGQLFPAITGEVGGYALVGLGAMLASFTLAPLTATLLLFELTRDYAVILPTMLACAAAYPGLPGLQPVQPGHPEPL